MVEVDARGDLLGEARGDLVGDLLAARFDRVDVVVWRLDFFVDVEGPGDVDLDLERLRLVVPLLPVTNGK